MKKVYLSMLTIGILLISSSCYFFCEKFYFNKKNLTNNETGAGENNNLNLDGSSVESEKRVFNKSQTEIIADNLNVPWEIVFLPDNSILVTERNGTLKKIGSNRFEINIPEVSSRGEGGLLGLALHPNYRENGFIYIYYTARNENEIKNKIERFRLDNDKIVGREMIMDNIPGSANHNGGRIKFGPDGFLYITTGDAGNDADAQSINSLAGKILRVRDDGSIPEDNPFESAVYSYGHRNAQGLAWDDMGQLWATEHGRSGVLSGYDEINLIKKGFNYGWPEIEGGENKSDMENPVINSGPNETWAPSGMVFYEGKLFFAGLRGESLYEYDIENDKLEVYFKGEFGRLRSVIVGADSNLYIITNNTDGRGTPKNGDDKIIKIYK